MQFGATNSRGENVKWICDNVIEVLIYLLSTEEGEYSIGLRGG